MLDAAILWWILSAASVIFLVLDWSHAPIDVTMHVGYLLIAAFMGPVGAILYILTVREPLPGTHRQYISARWKQVMGSTFHCVSGDSIGIVGAAIIVSFSPAVRSSMILDIVVEYVAGFLVGWLIFQSLFMKDMAGGRYFAAARLMFFPEWISMNGVMAGMVAVMVPWMMVNPQASTPGNPQFWLMMSLALMAGTVVAYPLNWWLVAAELKHGLMSTAPPSPSLNTHHADHSHDMTHKSPTRSLWPIILWSGGLLVAALGLAAWA